MTAITEALPAKAAPLTPEQFLQAITNPRPAISGRLGQVADLAHWRRNLRATAQASPELPAIVWALNDDWEFLSAQRTDIARLQHDLDRQYAHEVDAVYQPHIPGLPVAVAPPASPEPGSETPETDAAPVLDDHAEAALARFHLAHDQQDDADEPGDSPAAA